jgi:hypothetical protein
MTDGIYKHAIWDALLLPMAGGIIKGLETKPK